MNYSCERVERVLPLTEGERIIWVCWDYEIGRVDHLCDVCRDVLDAQAELCMPLVSPTKARPTWPP